jgi:hypothetical protein
MKGIEIDGGICGQIQSAGIEYGVCGNALMRSVSGAKAE